MRVADSFLAVPAPPTSPVRHRLRFHGTGAAYFRIWAVNLAITILSLGIYSPWAKVRRERYFLNNTELDGSPFDYHADPMNILKGRLLASSVIVVLFIVSELHLLANLLASLGFLALLPWMICRSLRFRAHNTSWRGLRFGFSGTSGRAALAWLAWPLAGILSLGLLAPMMIAAQWRYKLDHLHFGRTRFSIQAATRPIYRILLAASLLAVALGVAGGAAIFALLPPPTPPPTTGDAAGDRLIAASTFGLLWLVLVARMLAPYLRVRLENLRAHMSRLGPHRFESDQRVRAYYAILAVNWLLTLLTLGLYRPFAVTRLWRYRIEHFTVLADGDIGNFVAAQASAAPVVGAEAADLLDIDLGF